MARTRSTEEYLRLLKKQNDAIIAAEARKEEEKNRIQADPIRLEREEERRAKWGALRAREKPSKRPQRAHRLFGYTDLS